jgi:hypothetical protein
VHLVMGLTREALPQCLLQGPCAHTEQLWIWDRSYLRSAVVSFQWEAIDTSFCSVPILFSCMHGRRNVTSLLWAFVSSVTLLSLAAVNIKTAEIYRASFQDRGPEELLRAARALAGGPVSANLQ